MLSLTFIIVYAQQGIIVKCDNGKKEVYNKSNINEAKEICGGVNIYKYNDNSGLGAYFLNQEAVNRVIREEQEKQQHNDLD